MTDNEPDQDLCITMAAGGAMPIENSPLGNGDEPTLGARLRAARQARRLTVAECAHGLHVPAKVLQRLEANDFGVPEHFVFLRGALIGYARFLGLPAATCDAALRCAAPEEPPALVSVARVSSIRWLLQRYGTAATYIVLTATIAVPLVLLGLRGGLRRLPTQVVSLDRVPTTAAQPPASVRRRLARAPAVASPQSPGATPLRASMTPFGAIGLDDAAAPTAGSAPASVPVAAPAPTQASVQIPVLTEASVQMPASAPAPASALTPPVVPVQHTLTVTATADCWFAITAANGHRVATGTLHAGQSRTWHSRGLLHVTLGNAAGVSVTGDGQPVPLATYERSNVARFNVFGASDPSRDD